MAYQVAPRPNETAGGRNGPSRVANGVTHGRRGWPTVAPRKEPVPVVVRNAVPLAIASPNAAGAPARLPGQFKAWPPRLPRPVRPVRHGLSGHRPFPIPVPSRQVQERMRRTTSTMPAAAAAAAAAATAVPAAIRLQDWQKWDDLQVRVRGLASTITTLDLWRAFQHEGSIDAIELFEDKTGRKDGSARIRFRPPPSRPFWQMGRTYLPSLKGRYALHLDIFLEEKKDPVYIASPTNPEVRYPRIMPLNPVAIDFGFMYNETMMMVMRSSESVAGSKVVVELNLARKIVDIQFDLCITDPRGEGAPAVDRALALRRGADDIGAFNRTEKYRFRIPLDQLQRVQEVEETPSKRFWIISLETPPNFYRKAAGPLLEASHEKGALFWGEWHTWYRQTDIVYDPRELRTVALSLKKTKPVIDIGRWTTYRLTFDMAEGDMMAYQRVCRALQDYNINIEKVDTARIMSNGEPAVWDWIDPPTSKVDTAKSFLAAFQEATVTPLSFAVRYQLEVCISQGRLNEYNLSEAFVNSLAELDPKRALRILVHVAEQKNRIYDPMTLFKLTTMKSSVSDSKIPHYCAHSRKATVTPSMIYFNTPVVETSNRVVRQYLEHSDRFLRVQFTDEKFQGRINSTYKNTTDEVFTRVRRALANGITIGDRHYEFLAFGNSQFREHGAYFFAPTLHLKTDDIRRWMGDFSHIREVARYAARIGQCFSTTRAISGTRVQVRTTQDVKTGPYNFTDGVGKISESLAKLVTAELRLPFVPSVFQFRLGGCKGVLAIWPDAQKWEIHIRPSQYKFAAMHNGLEIIRWSQFAAAALNRQLITVLSALGVPNEVFVRKLQDMLANLERAMHDEHLALELLQKHVDPNQTTLTIAALVAEGFMKSKEPFVASLLQLWQAWSIKYLKERAKIVIDQGAFVLGCTDETQTLRGHFAGSRVDVEGSMQGDVSALPEIFLQVPDPEAEGRYKAIEGLCLLARNPSLHPGDIRVVNAVDKPQLRHIRDAVVLPQTGDRDVASMCSGGDLDGDDYLVMWDPELIPAEWNHPPMDYTPPSPVELNRDVTKDDITGFFVQYMKNDRLRSIALAHLAWADQRDLGVKDNKCLRLAALHSKAVDYVKTGEPAQMGKELRPRDWPHFMEKQHIPEENIYRSGNILGQLYDKVERVHFVPRQDAKFDPRILDAYELDEQTLRDAKFIKSQYDADMRRIMAQHEIKTEFEVWSTFALSHANMSKDYKFHEELGQIAGALKDRYRNACLDKVGSRDMKELGPFVAAMYRATHDEVVAALAKAEPKPDDGTTTSNMWSSETPMPLISFPWCFADVLGKIAVERSKQSEAEQAVEQLEGVTWRHSKHSRAQQKISGKTVNDAGDMIETAEGVTHRGEILELFHQGEIEAEPKAEPEHEQPKASNNPEQEQPEPSNKAEHEQPEPLSRVEHRQPEPISRVEHEQLKPSINADSPLELKTVISLENADLGYFHAQSPESPEIQAAGSGQTSDESLPVTPRGLEVYRPTTESITRLEAGLESLKGESDVTSEYVSAVETLESGIYVEAAEDLETSRSQVETRSELCRDRLEVFPERDDVHNQSNDRGGNDDEEEEQQQAEGEGEEEEVIMIVDEKETAFEALEKLLSDHI